MLFLCGSLPNVFANKRGMPGRVFRMARGLGLACAFVAAFTACRFGKGEGGRSPRSDANSLVTSNGKEMLFALMLADPADVQGFRAQVSEGATAALPERPLPVCFFLGSDLTDGEKAKIHDASAGLGALSAHTRSAKIQPVRKAALDSLQAERVVGAVVDCLRLGEGVIQAVFSSDEIRTSEARMSDDSFDSLVDGIAAEEPGSPQADFSAFPCSVDAILGNATPAGGGASQDSLGLVTFHPLLKKGISIGMPLIAAFVTTTKSGVVAMGRKDTSNFVFATRMVNVAKTKDRVALAVRARNVAPLTAPPRQ
jgi:hypothetical protein